MRNFAFAVLATAAAAMSEFNVDFLAYAATYNKVYRTHTEFSERKALWEGTDAYIKAVNRLGASHRAGHNKFSDWTDAERATLKTYKPSKASPNATELFSAHGLQSVGDAKDWRDTEGVVFPVRNEGACGATWAISIIASVEGAYTLAGNEPTQMSPQELMDCGMGVAGDGCNGGYLEGSYDWLKTNKTMREADYPYQGRNGECQYDEAKGVTNVVSHTQVTGDVASIKAAIDQQPLTIATCANNRTFQFYKSGIIRASDCSCRPDHTMTAVGYGVEDGVAFYIMKNQWGADWGEDGYARLEQAEGDGTCNMNGQVYFPNL